MAKKKLSSYNEAYEELQTISAKLESGEADIDQLTVLVKRAKELVKFCQDKLRATESELSETEKSS
ncbi:exodeoxyribonuclease VII small subunit [Gilvimarinus agarilyticus]|uniref:Exodeoxyribonuclease VII small subunit n=1 Tax=Reichenbachiella agariperforans TaxID=156994 RepID=A0A1M6K185_REIAG|nr:MULTISPECIES: exodeoxyribonuclease VII small subunit [Reichenbachiella]MBU2887934.1 exodeoxyribonuclease VII small subunit [Gilvimarinus agarilyticus]MBU2913381.1 exodeoxyribonuclease VII small subunit [Reichenbachiella agariperforans]RJE74635.1 exodeoxyribonuclease VII small subunit [Reichenbachiella sp. MSK19-1]SHJ52654.1 Exodeoxyribonuclease VII small subunit [Reichenbachiella agariperforans]